MSIYDDIRNAESRGSDKTVEIPAEEFLDLIDLWVHCGVLFSEIESENEESAAQAVLGIAEIYQKLGEKYGN